MTPDSPGRRERERAIFDEVCDVPDPAGRAARLVAMCGGDSELQQRLERLLAAADRAGDFFEPPHPLSSPAQDSGLTRTALLPAGETLEGPGSTVGRYRLGEQLGEGGFGRVYRADQLEPVRRQVALKILKPGMDTREIIARFEGERQALALMDHPHVAHVLDAGATAPPDSRPYFVMELVEGLPITAYCDQQCLAVADRIALFLPVCHAVQHAHQKGIIHRDIKPSNILVATRDDRPHPLVIDFGIAKAVQEPLTSGVSALTRVDQIIGTPAYMSPEQASGGRDVDTRADIYALGVVLYELLTGRTPFGQERLREAGPAGLQRILLEEDPLLPSVRVQGRDDETSAAAAARGSTPGRLATQLAGELDWIVQKALEKDRNRRYATANALARDLNRYLHDEAVQARPPSAGYLARKFFLRHRHAAVAALGIGLALFIGLLLAMVGFLEARKQTAIAKSAERDAVKEAAYARQIAYASDLNLVRHALENSNLGLARALLDRQRPRPGQVDLRRWEWHYLKQACQNQALVRLGSHDQSVTALTFDARSERLVSAGLDGTIKLWDLAGRRLVATLSDAGSRFAWSTEERLLATSNPQAGVQLWDSGSDRVLGRLWTDDAMTALVFARRGKRLYGAGQDGRLLAWDIPARELVAGWKVTRSSGLHNGDLAVASHGNWILHGGSDGHVRKLDADQGATLAEWPAHDEAITALALAPDDDWVATGAGFTDSSIRLWRAADGALAGRLEGHRAWVAALCFAPGSALLASGSADQTIRLWHPPTGALRATLRGHLSEVWSLAFLPDGKTLVSGDKEGVINLWDLPAAERGLTSEPPPIRQAQYCSESGLVVGLDADGEIRGLDPLTGNGLPPLQRWGQRNVLLASATQGAAVAAVDFEGTLRLELAEPGPGAAQPALVATHLDLSLLRFTPDARRLVTVSHARLVQVYDSASLLPVAVWDAGESALGPIAISPDGSLLASGGAGLVVFDLMTGRRVAEIQSHLQPTDAVAFSPDGRLVATGSQEGLAKLWEVDSWTLQAVFRGHLLGVHAVAFSPDGRRLATGSVGDEVVKLWDLGTRQEVLNLAWPGQLARSLEFSPDGRSLFATSGDSVVRFWHAPLAKDE